MWEIIIDGEELNDMPTEFLTDTQTEKSLNSLMEQAMFSDLGFENRLSNYWQFGWLSETECSQILEAWNNSNQREYDDLAFASIFALFINYRDNCEGATLVHRYGEMLNSFYSKSEYTKKYKTVMDYIYLTYEISRPEQRDKKEATFLMEMAYQLVETDKHHGGYKNTFAELFITLVESSSDLGSGFVHRWKQMALNEIEKAPEYHTESSVFYCTKARLLAFEGKFDDAVEAINTAIMIENESPYTSYTALSKYNYHLSATNLAKKERELESQQERIILEVDNLKKVEQKNLELLGLFAAVIAFFVGGISVVTSPAVSIKTILGIIVVAGCLIIVACTFFLLFHYHVDISGKSKHIHWELLASYSIGFLITTVAVVLVQIL